MQILFMILLLLTSLFLIMLILVQRGKGGGLAGAFGGMGGQSAFGTKAGDVFTRATIIAATIWILLCVLSIVMLGSGENRFAPGLGADAATDGGRELLGQSPASGTDQGGPAGGDALSNEPAAAEGAAGGDSASPSGEE